MELEEAKTKIIWIRNDNEEFDALIALQDQLSSLDQVEFNRWVYQSLKAIYLHSERSRPPVLSGATRTRLGNQC